jgi:hypothetical protein
MIDTTKLTLAKHPLASRFLSAKKPSFDTLQEERRRFALLDILRHLFSEATAAAARRTTSPVQHSRRDE